jgi:hypothetical protein
MVSGVGQSGAAAGRRHRPRIQGACHGLTTAGVSSVVPGLPGSRGWTAAQSVGASWQGLK